jgi:agmatine deiminase
MRVLLPLTVLLLSLPAHAVRPDLKNQPKVPAGAGPAADVPHSFTTPPAPVVTPLAEWEDSDGVMISWPNRSVVAAYAARGLVYLIADSEEDRLWWEEWLRKEHVGHAENIRFWVIPTDTIWVRDYGPWYILDGDGDFGLVDNRYFPQWRPQDDAFPAALGELLDLPVYETGITIEGGNFYTHGHHLAFSTSSVLFQNPALTGAEINQRMNEVMGIWAGYAKFKLGDSDTAIEHLDTFLKPLSPDTWVVADFPEGSRYREQANAVAKRLAEEIPSGYLTANRVVRMPMVPKAGANPGELYYRGYINSFISNRTLYFPTYGGAADQQARRIYQDAMPGYEIVGVEAGTTWWTDSVHCRSRNLIRRDTLFLSTYLTALPVGGEEIGVQAKVTPSPGSAVKGIPRVHWQAGEGKWQVTEMERFGPRWWNAALPGQPAGTRVRYYVDAADTRGRAKTAPLTAPLSVVEFTVKD